MRVTSLLKLYMQMDSNNYPETLARMAIINAPGWFTTSWGAVKSVLSAETVKKIEVGLWRHLAYAHFCSARLRTPHVTL